MSLVETVRSFLVSESLEQKPLCVAVSGGIDSSVLFDVLLQCVDVRLISVFHVHHGVRAQSDIEYEFLKTQCEKKGVPFYGYMVKNVPNANKESFWRDQRRLYAQEVLQHTGADRVLTAHHATDLVETMLFRMTKGCGVDGLSPFDISTKPLWSVPKSEIKEYAQRHNVLYQEDESNQDTQYARNRIRHNVIPELRIITPNIEKVMVHESLLFQEVSDYINIQVRDFLKKYANGIPLNIFTNQPKLLQREVFRQEASSSMSFSETEDALRWINGNVRGNSKKQIGGKLWTVKKGILFKGKGDESPPS